ncbi:glycoside hydrolase family 172 protein [Sphingomonas sp.]|uniref:glycoside hydrolase family 172 protein n=1 Tax=Sphingomonas sp. TaxID=28214 RepID=UPI0025E4729A|nr:glycoside hydrolase family 172 protein [Sphingomonas sp.]
MHGDSLEPYLWNPKLVSRAISFENPTGTPGMGGQAASPLGPGRKGSAWRFVEPQSAVTLADITGPGSLRHWWMTTRLHPGLARGVMIRIYWEDSAFPSVELPLGEFFGFAQGRCQAFQSAMHSVTSAYGMNCWLPMPFLRHARVELVNETDWRFALFYQIDYTLGDDHPADLGRLHAGFRRESPTRIGTDFEILPRRTGAIRYLGAILGIGPSEPRWWGEGEVKVYIDGDQAFPTICGTGAEDYVGCAYGVQDQAFLHHGLNFREQEHDEDTGRVSLYRWHLADPIVCAESIRVTIQQIGIDSGMLYERADDWSAAAFWYERGALQPLWKPVGVKERVADLIG